MVRVGVLALQGAFLEHAAMLRGLGAEVVEVRKPEQLAGLDGLVMPGGESTTMGLVAERWGLVEPLRAWVQAGKPVWGTCAGMILLADHAVGQKQGGQPLIGGLDVTVNRNYFGRQNQSFEVLLEVPALGDEPFRAVFIRAPAIRGDRAGGAGAGGGAGARRAGDRGRAAGADPGDGVSPGADGRRALAPAVSGRGRGV